VPAIGKQHTGDLATLDIPGVDRDLWKSHVSYLSADWQLVREGN
jgi:hypothetical protein